VSHLKGPLEGYCGCKFVKADLTGAKQEPLRFDESAQELVCDSIGVAYPIRNGVPHLIPADARMLHSDAAQ